MRAFVNPSVRTDAVEAPSGDATPFHQGLEGYAPTPVRDLPALAAELGLAMIGVKDESDRLGLPAFKVLGASWAVERALREQPGVHTLVAASAGNHGRAVANVAKRRGLECRVYLPARSVAARREAIAGEGAEVVVVEGSYEHAVAQAQSDGEREGHLEIADVGDSGPASWVIDGYATLFAEVEAEGRFDVLIVPVGVGSLAAAAARFAAQAGATLIAVEPASAACLTASLAAGKPTVVDTPGTSMAGLDCAEISIAAWPSLRDGVHGTITVDDGEAHSAMRELATEKIAVGESGAAPLAALRALLSDPECGELRAALDLGSRTRVLLLATEGPTDPESYRRALSGAGAGEE